MEGETSDNMKTIVSQEGQMLLPAEFRLQDNVQPGQEFEVQRIRCGEYLLVRRETPASEGLIDRLLACPEKDFFVRIDSESTDSL